MKRQGYYRAQILEIIITVLALATMLYAIKVDSKYQADFDRTLKAHPECATSGSMSSIRACVKTYKRLEKLK